MLAPALLRWNDLSEMAWLTRWWLFWTWLDSTAADCPLSYAGFTVYATLDTGLGYYSQGAAWNPAVFNGTQGLISKQSNGSKNNTGVLLRLDPRKHAPDGRHQIGTSAGFKSELVAGFPLECPAGFIGIRTHRCLSSWSRRNHRSKRRGWMRASVDALRHTFFVFHACSFSPGSRGWRLGD